MSRVLWPNRISFGLYYMTVIDRGRVGALLVGLRASLERRVIIRLGERRRGTA